MTNIVVIDTETTGFDPVEDRIVEIAAARLLQDGEWYETDWVRTCLVDPERSIPATASAVHHVTDADVVDARKIDPAIAYLGLRKGDILVAHNAAFDRSFLPQLSGHSWVCTWRCAQVLIPDAPSYGNQVLRYHLGIDVETGNGRMGQPHSAGYDARTTAGIMSYLLTKASVEDMLILSEAPLLLPKITFGKHKGTPFGEVPKDYLRWLKGQPDLDRDLRHTLEYHT